MTEKINLHTHCLYCDGKNSPEEMVKAAIEKGFTTLGFSSHSLFPFARSWHITPKDFLKYESEIKQLKEKYSDQIEILLGYEADYFPGISEPTLELYKNLGLSPDYLIGSTHYVVTDKGHYTVDNSTEKVRDHLTTLYGNGKDFSSVNGKKAVGDYFAAQREMLAKGNFQIIGHCDLIRIRNVQLNFFNEQESWYKKELKATAKAISKAGVVVEINTGAIARGTMNDFYPSAEFLSILHSLKVPVCVNSDCHNAELIDCAYDKAYDFARKIGYSELVYPLGNTTKIIKL